MTRTDARDLRKLAYQASREGEPGIVWGVYTLALVFAIATAVAVMVSA
jgi:hypothetical protein